MSYHLDFILLEEYIRLEIIEGLINNVIIITYIMEKKWKDFHIIPF